MIILLIPSPQGMVLSVIGEDCLVIFFSSGSRVSSTLSSAFFPSTIDPPAPALGFFDAGCVVDTAGSLLGCRS